MALFSWFYGTNRNNSVKNNKASLEQELTTFNNNTMWPVAKVRRSILVQQQEYVNSASHLQQESKIKVLKKSKHKVLKEHIS